MHRRKLARRHARRKVGRFAEVGYHNLFLNDLLNLDHLLDGDLDSLDLYDFLLDLHLDFFNHLDFSDDLLFHLHFLDDFDLFDHLDRHFLLDDLFHLNHLRLGGRLRAARRRKDCAKDEQRCQEQC